MYRRLGIDLIGACTDEFGHGSEIFSDTLSERKIPCSIWVFQMPFDVIRHAINIITAQTYRTNTQSLTYGPPTCSIYIDEKHPTPPLFYNIERIVETIQEDRTTTMTIHIQLAGTGHSPE